MHDTTDGGETTQTLQKFSSPALLATWAGQLFSSYFGASLVSYLFWEQLTLRHRTCASLSPAAPHILRLTGDG